MKNKKNIQLLKLNKKSISTLNRMALNGGLAECSSLNDGTGDCTFQVASDCCTYINFCTLRCKKK